MGLEEPVPLLEQVTELPLTVSPDSGTAHSDARSPHRKLNKLCSTVRYSAVISTVLYCSQYSAVVSTVLYCSQYSTVVSTVL